MSYMCFVQKIIFVHVLLYLKHSSLFNCYQPKCVTVFGSHVGAHASDLKDDVNAAILVFDV